MWSSGRPDGAANCRTGPGFTWPAAPPKCWALSIRWCLMSTSALEPSRFGETAQVRAAGGYLRNVVRPPPITCRVCAAPVDGFDRCWRCDRARRIGGVADVVAPLTYAIA